MLKVINVFSSNGGSSQITDSNGYYEVNVPNGWSGIVMPDNSLNTFDPQSNEYTDVNTDISGQDFIRLGVGGFTEIDAGLVGVHRCSLAWGDYNNDGDLDLALSGNTGSGSVSKIYCNTNGVFEDIGAGLPGSVSLAWGDYDNDGGLDLALATYTGSGFAGKIYRKIGSNFIDIGAGLDGIDGQPVWGDYDNDGDLDLAIAGSGMSEIYRNTDGIFANTNAGLTGVSSGSSAWGDYDNDGDLDLALAGYTWSGAVGSPVSKIYRNDNSTFTDINAGLIDVSGCCLAWGDYDNDGDLDLALAGYTWSGAVGSPVSKIYRNDNSTFTDICAGLTGGFTLAWGDYDNDGDLDLALAVYTGIGFDSRIYRNNNGIFSDIGAGIIGIINGSLAWGDYDNDGDLDLALTGLALGGKKVSKIYKKAL